MIKDFIIPKGTVICRYGSPRGRFSTYKGTDYDTLSLPYIRETIEYHEYIVTTYLKVVCIVTKGITAPMFDSSGGAVQFMHRQTIELECSDSVLKEVDLWSHM